MPPMFEESGLISTMSARSRWWSRTALVKRASLKPSCISIRMAANATPDSATRRRRGWCVSCLKASANAETISGSTREDRDLDLEVGETPQRVALLEADPHLDDAGVGAGGRVRSQHIHLADLQSDPLHGAVPL